jgi:hypothetical protein
MKKLLSLVCFLGFMATFVWWIPYVWGAYELVAENPGGKLTGIQQFAGIMVVGMNASFVIGALILTAFGTIVPLIPVSENTTGSTGAR